MTDQRLTPAQASTLEEIEQGVEDDCTVMLPPGMVYLRKDVWPPKIVLTDAGREVLEHHRSRLGESNTP